MPTLNPFAERRYRRRFAQPFGDDNLYYGVYRSYQEAQAAAEGFASRSLPATYDVEAAGRIYRNQVEGIRVSDYPLVYWMRRLLSDGARRIFDLGGNIGVSYYAFAPYLDYPEGVQWRVHDLPRAMAAGAELAERDDPRRRLSFAKSEKEADGHDVLVCTGALQYLPYSMADLLAPFERSPPHILINLTPMHADREYFTLQNLGIAICPYRVGSTAALLADMKRLGYTTIDQWSSRERSLDVPFHPEATIDGYSGFYFRRDASA